MNPLRPVRTAAAAAVALITGVTLSAVGTSAVVPAAAGAHANGSADGELLSSVASTQYASPNGDGVQDDIGVGIVLARRATLTATVRRDGPDGPGAIVRRESLGSLAAGQQRWRWNGRNERGRVVGDGKYVIKVVASSGSGAVRREDAEVRVALRSVYKPWRARGSATFVLSRDTVYPRTRSFADAVYIRRTHTVMKSDQFGGWEGHRFFPRLEIRNSRGRVVRKWPRAKPSRLDAAWTATTRKGSALPAGTYTVAIRTRDWYGNTGWIKKKIEVSADPLVVRRKWSATVSAAEALSSKPYYCGAECIDRCQPSPSTRTEGALTVRSRAALEAAETEPNTMRCTSILGQFEVKAPFKLRTRDRVTVTATGGEHPAGGTGGVGMALWSVWPSSTYYRTTIGAGHLTMGPAFHMGRQIASDSFTFGQTPSEHTNLVRWSVHNGDLDGTEYDLETFEVEVVRYGPAR